MAGKKTKPKKSKTTQKPAAAKPKPAARATSAAPERVELGMLAARPPIDDVTRAAFRSQCDEARAEAYGEETKSLGVLTESRTWCVRIEQTLSSLRAGQKVRYTPARLTWLLECVSALADQIEVDGGRGGARGGALSSVEVATTRARTARNDLLLALTEIADGGDARQAELADARGTADKAPDLLVSLRSVVDLAARWANTFDPQMRALVASTGLSADDIDGARTAASELATALGGKTTAQAALGRDSVAVNRLEGRVLFELGKAMTALNAAADQGIGARLVPGPATRRVLAPPPGKHPKKSPASPAAPAAS